MCDKESFAKIRYAIVELQKADAVQSEQIKTLFLVTERQGDTQTRLVNRLVLAVIGVLVLAVLALIFGALGERGFKAVTTAAQTAVATR
ncbi:MAG: hypothetical protein PUE68_10875 [Kiritimatiellae bacterium]|nr:hypothetical protein [Kiritimatiellia bacterium]